MNHQAHEPEKRKIWFPAKRYGWGWGPPCCWQGWVFFLTWLAALVAGLWLIRPKHLVAFLIYDLLCVVVLFVVLFLKGEKPRWRWGGK